ncbi:MAG: HEAT repeat domain-containing protein [Fimbriiglobus sp.]
MKRWLWCATLAAGVGVLPILAQHTAQVPPQTPALTALPKAEASVGDVLSMKGGQMDRQVRILKIVGTAETDGLADVQDLATGAKYSIPLKAVALLNKVSGPAATSASAANPAMPANGLQSVTATMPRTAPPTQTNAGENGWPRTATKPTDLNRTTFPSYIMGQPLDPKKVMPPVNQVRNLMNEAPTNASYSPPANANVAPKEAQASHSEAPRPLFSSKPKPTAPSRIPAPSYAEPVPGFTPPAAPAQTASVGNTHYKSWPQNTPVAPPPAAPAKPAPTFIPVPSSQPVATATPAPVATPVANVTPPVANVTPTFKPATTPLPAPKPPENVAFRPAVPQTPPMNLVATPPSATPTPPAPPAKTVPLFTTAPETVPAKADLAKVTAPLLPTGSDLGVPPAPARNLKIATPTLKIAPPEYTEVPVLDLGPAPVAPLPEKPSIAIAAVPAPTATPSAPVSTPAPVTTATTPPAIPTTSVVQANVPSQWKPLPEPAPVSIIPTGLYEQAPVQMVEEIQPYVNDLATALRPSLRERAASALAEGRYGSRPEVKATLARAAFADPAPSVRAHCIKQLSKLGYHEASYLNFLAACAESKDTDVKQAATTALAKLQSKN